MTSTPLMTSHRVGNVAIAELPVQQVRDNHAQELEVIARYYRAANYLAVAEIYLQDNVLLKEPLIPEHIKERLLRHWGTCPSVNLIYAHLNRLIRHYDVTVILVTAPANLANLYLEGTLKEYYPEVSLV